MVMDEEHFLADRMRGPVWEEVILPDDVRVVSLSATVSSMSWRLDPDGAGDTTVVVDEHQPVPLWQHVLVGRSACSTCSITGSAKRGSPSQPRVAAPHRASP